MEGEDSMRIYQEHLDGLKMKLLHTTIELERFKREVGEAMRKSTEEVKHLYQLIQLACQERDEARNQIQMLLAKHCVPPTNSFSSLQATPLGMPTKANINTTDPISLSTTTNSFPCLPNTPMGVSTKLNSSAPSPTYNYHSQFPSCDPFVQNVTSPDFFDTKTNDDLSITDAFLNSPVVEPNANNMIPYEIPQVKQNCFEINDDLVINNLTEGKPLPQKGKFLEAMLHAGPLLENVFAAGSTPRWQNPPRIETFDMSPVSILGTAPNFSHNAASSINSIASGSKESSSFAEMSAEFWNS